MDSKKAEDISLSILKNVSAGLALFNLSDLSMRWCNASFKKQTWFGGATGGKQAAIVTVQDLFDKRDHAAIFELINIMERTGKAYDFQRMVRRGPVGSFPAELKLNRIQDAKAEVFICIEIQDLSLNKLYEELESAHTEQRERLADLMSAQAELQFSVRMNTISEIGADMAHQLINPVTMCRDILETHVLPNARDEAVSQEIKTTLRYLKDIQDLAVWFRKFSNPRLTETQICNVVSMIEDALSLNMNRFSKLGIVARLRRSDERNPFILAVPINLIMWLNATFSELMSAFPNGGEVIYIDLACSAETVVLKVHCNGEYAPKHSPSTNTLEKFAQRLPGSARFETEHGPHILSFNLSMACFSDSETEDIINSNLPSVVISSGKVEKSGDARQLQPTTAESIRPLVLFVDDEKDIRRLLKRTFKNLNLEGIEACDGQEALEYFKNPQHRALANRVKVIVSDVRMPRMAGPHFLVGLREIDVQLPFIFFSSNLVDSGQSGQFKDDNVYYLTKESGMEELKFLVQQFMNSEAIQKTAPEIKRTRAS